MTFNKPKIPCTFDIIQVTLSNGNLYVNAQIQTFPDRVFAGTSQAQLHGLMLKSTNVKDTPQQQRDLKLILHK
jgi:hypothetical protein